MNRYLILIITLLSFLLMPAESLSAKKKKKAEDIPHDPPTPDLRIPALKSQKPLQAVHELSNPSMAKKNVHIVATAQGNHTAQERGGIDVSHYQGQINWSTVARTGKVLYAFCKATESNTILDNTFVFNVREARKAGIPVGCYHFFRPNVSGKAQIEHFIKSVDMSTQDVLPMLDIEVRGKESLEEFHEEIRVWLKTFEAHYHFKPIIYASLNFYNKYLAGAFDDYIYMIAKYGDGTPNPKGQIPFAMWQYTSNGSVEGIKGRVDMSCFIDHFDVKDILIKNHK